MEPAASPSERLGHVLAYDSIRGQTVLFGGRSQGSSNDTWELPSNRPPQVTATANPGSSSGNVSFSWQQTDGPAVTFAQEDGRDRTVDFTPVKPGVHVFECKARLLDDPGSSTEVSSRRSIRVVVDSQNRRVPEARIRVALQGDSSKRSPLGVEVATTTRYFVRAGDVILLDGSNSGDAGLGYSWVQVDGPEVGLSNPLSPLTTFVAPDLGDRDRARSYHFQLYSQNNNQRSAPDVAEILVLPANAQVITLDLLPGLNLVSIFLAPPGAGGAVTVDELVEKLGATLAFSSAGGILRPVGGALGRAGGPYAQLYAIQTVACSKMRSAARQHLDNYGSNPYNSSVYIERAQTIRLHELMTVFPAVVVTGARQVGKTTLLQHAFGDGTDIVVFDPVMDVENARQDPDLFLSNHVRAPLVLDEVQYVPEVVSALKRQIDRDRSPGRYVLTGSQQWGVLASIADSLAGRVVFVDLEGFSLAEMARKPTSNWLAAWLDQPRTASLSELRSSSAGEPVWEQIWRGFLPEAQTVPAHLVPEYLTAYLRTYVERDVRQLANVSDWQLFGRFVRLVAALTAQEINYSQLGREIGVHPETTRRWLDVLRATFQWHETQPFSGNAVKRLSSRPKGYFSDTGLACMAQAISSPVALGGHPMWGALFESAVAGEIRKLCALISPRPNIYHWRTHGGAEVDVVLERDGTCYPMEVKGSSHPSQRDASGITAFRETYPRMDIAPGLVLAPTERAYPLTADVWAVPWNASAPPKG